MCWSRLWLSVHPYTKPENCLTFDNGCKELQWSCPALATSPTSTRTFECILKDLPGEDVGESCQKSYWRWCACLIGCGAAITSCWGITVCLESVCGLLGWWPLHQVMYWVDLKLDADVNMCNLWDLSSVHASVWRPLAFKALSQCNETNPVKSANTSLPVFIMKDCVVSLESRCIEAKLVQSWKYHQCMLEPSTSCNACAKVEFPTKHDGISIITCLHHGQFGCLTKT